MGWSDSLRMGIKEIDEQHQALFEVLARLERAIDKDSRWSAVHYALVELDSYVKIHFTVEEALMRLHDYPDIDAHIAMHRKFSAELASIKQHSIQRDVSEEMTRLLKDWLVNHIDGADKAYVPHLRTAAVRR